MLYLLFFFVQSHLYFVKLRAFQKWHLNVRSYPGVDCLRKLIFALSSVGFCFIHTVLLAEMIAHSLKPLHFLLSRIILLFIVLVREILRRTVACCVCIPNLSQSLSPLAKVFFAFTPLQHSGLLDLIVLLAEIGWHLTSALCAKLGLEQVVRPIEHLLFYRHFSLPVVRRVYFFNTTE